jgi:hypothetical protein
MSASSGFNSSPDFYQDAKAQCFRYRQVFDKGRANKQSSKSPGILEKCASPETLG